MFLGIIISVFAGIIAGTLTGLIPGIHINLVGAILVSLSLTIFSGIQPIYLIVFIVSMAIAHTFIDFIPSIFLGCPDTETQLSVLPGHELLKEGKGYEAIMLTAYGGLIATIIIVFISFPLSIMTTKVYDLIHSLMFWILLITFIILIFTEKKKITALFVFIISGLLGLCVLNLDMKEPLLPLLTGLFGSSLLIISIKNKIEIPKQEIIFQKCKFKRPIIGALLASPLCGFLPGLGSGQAAILGNTISKNDRKGFLVLIGATNVLVMELSFVSLYAISRTRTGAAAAIQEIIGTVSWKFLLLILITVLISGTISFLLTKNLAKFLSSKMNKINYTIISSITLIILTIIVLIFSGFSGLLVLIASTLVGIYCHKLDVKKTNMMGCLLLPTIIFYGMKLI